MTTRIWHSIRHIAKIFTFHLLPPTVLSKCYPPPVSVHHPVEERVEAVVEAGEGPEQLLEPEVELLGAGLVRPPPDGHHVVRGPAQREPQHQHAHDLHSLHLHRELLNFDIVSLTNCSPSLAQWPLSWPRSSEWLDSISSTACQISTFYLISDRYKDKDFFWLNASQKKNI